MFKRLLTAFAIAAMVLPAALPAAAATWNWTDISDQLTVRSNRPVWAMAYANGSWFYTDGQDLWNGGQVYRYDGSTQVNITLDVRNAGLSRVDDIVSDGQTVVFLKNVVARNNQFEAFSYYNGSYANRTSALRAAFGSGEGISSIVGRNGTWYLVTTKARLLQWNGDNAIPTQLSLPFSVPGMNADMESAMTYNVNHGSPSSDFSSIVLAIVPITNGNWLLAEVTQDSQSVYKTYRMYRLQGTSFTDVTASFPKMYYMRKFVSNGSTAVIADIQPGSSVSYGEVVFYDGTNVASKNYDFGFYPYNDLLLQWNGSSWIAVQGKNVYRLFQTGFESLGTTRDFFVTMASNGSGTMLLGGAVSTEALSQPSFPLTAKLVKTTDFGTSTNTQTTNTSNPSNVDSGTGIASWAWLSPNVSTLKGSESTTYNVGAWDTNGIKRIEIVVNGIVRRTCDLGNATGNQSCSFQLFASDYAVGTNVSFNAKVTDAQDKFVWAPLMSIAIPQAQTDQPVTQNTQNAQSAPATWVWAIPPDTNLVPTMSTYHVGAWDADGLSRIEIWVNGAVRRTCTYPATVGNVECSWDVLSSDYAKGSEIFVNAKVSDALGNVTWAASKSFRTN